MKKEASYRHLFRLESEPLEVFTVYDGSVDGESIPFKKSGDYAITLSKYIAHNDWLRGCQLIERVLRRLSYTSVCEILLHVPKYWQIEVVDFDGEKEECIVFDFGSKYGKRTICVISMLRVNAEEDCCYRAVQTVYVVK